MYGCHHGTHACILAGGGFSASRVAALASALLNVLLDGSAAAERAGIYDRTGTTSTGP